MKRKIRVYVLIAFGSFMILSIALFVLGHYSIVKNSYEDKFLDESMMDTKLIESELTYKLKLLEQDTSYLGQDLTYLYEKPIYLIQEFLKSHQGIEAIYLYDETQTQIGVYKVDDGYDSVVQNIIKELFFYTPIVWTEIEDNIYCVTYKLPTSKAYYLGYIVNMEKYLSDFTSDRFYQGTVFNSFGRSVVSTLNGRTEGLGDEVFKETLLNGHSETGIYDDRIISYRKINYEGLDLFLYLENSTQEYVGLLRLYKVRILAISLFLVTIGAIVGWKLSNGMYGIIVIEALSGEHKAEEFSQIKQELGKAIIWIDDVVMHYDELNELKEELIELNEKLPKEDETHVQRKKSKHKK